MRSLGDVSAQPAKGLRHPEKGPERGFFVGDDFGSVLGDGSGEGQKRA